MDIIAPFHLRKIRKVVGFFIVSCCLIGFVGNIITSHSLLNLLVLAFLSLTFFFTSIINHAEKLLCAIQILLILVIGVITIFYGDYHYVGDMIFLLGILLTYTYGFLKIYSYLSIIPLIVIIAILKWLSSAGSMGNVISTIVSSSIILFIWTLSKVELNQYIRESQKNESLARIGMNAGNFLHNLHLATARRIVKGALKHNTRGNTGKTTQYLNQLEGWIDEKTAMRSTIVQAITTNRTTDTEKVDIHKTILMVLETLYFDERVLTRIQIHKEFLPMDLFIKAVPFEIYYILQNAFMNATEAMLATTRKTNILSIKTEIKEKALHICISDTGPGFKMKRGQVDLRSKKPNGGYGTKYIQAMIGNYQGKALFSNSPGEYGATVTLIFPRQAGIMIQFRQPDSPTPE